MFVISSRSSKKRWRRLKRRLRKSRSAQVALVGVLGTLLVVMAVLALRANDPTVQRFADKVAATPGSRQAGPPVLLVIGDSGTAGTLMNSPGHVWASLVADQLAWKLNVDAVSGTGYVVDGTGVRFVSRIGDDAGRFHPDVVVLAGGSNDLQAGVPPGEIMDAVKVTVERVQQAFPGVPIVLFSAWSAGEPTSTHLALADAMKEYAGRQSIPFLDVSWFTVGGPGIVGSDGRHPTDRGHELIAFRVVESGVLQTVVPRR